MERFKVFMTPEWMRDKSGRSKTDPKTLGLGGLAPDFCLPDQFGNTVCLSDFRDKQPLVLFFYPKDYSPICTLESIAFSSFYSDFITLGAEVIGISADPPESHKRFCKQFKLHFRLLTDRENKVRAMYGEEFLDGNRTSRVTYVIDKHGVIRMTYAALLRAKKHAVNALDTVRQLEVKSLDSNYL